MIPRMPHRKRSSPLTIKRPRQPAGRRLTAAVVAFTALGMVASAGPATSAEPSSLLSEATIENRGGERFDLAAIGGSQDLEATTTTKVTLITGDSVTVTHTGSGGYSATIEPAPRPNGRPVLTQTLVDDDHVYVLPSDAAELVAAGRLDRQLFDVKYLVENGYGDDTTKHLPVIVQFRKPSREAELAEQSAALPASTRTHTLESVNGASLNVPKEEADLFWSAVTSPGAATSAEKVAPSTMLEADIAKVWLDSRVNVELEQSVPLIGAPQAWAAGYDGSGVKVAVLDTGIDATHPDLAGKVVSSQSFVEGQEVQDGHGHGTHVASTIVGSGAASAGRFKGVAPGAQLVVGKVLSDAGSGTSAQIIDGMEWATSQGARVVNMSLGGSPTDGTDPMSQAVNELTGSSGALFVIAAGNSGPTARSIGTPGAADSALTVAAVDKNDRLADFSSRGPRAFDYALKPDIAGPGVGITAARAQGTSMGTPVDDRYTSASGTSMATPHVVGAAAILVEKHPDWSAEQLKAGLTGTAKDDGYTVYEQGSGRVDVSAAVAAGVYPSATNLDFGRLRWPQQGPPVTKTLTYRNTTDQPVTLSLSSDLRQTTGGAAPEGMLTVSPSSVEVPAGGGAEVSVTLDPTRGDPALYSGAVRATAADGTSLRTAVGAYKEAEGYELTVKSIAPEAATAGRQSFWVIRRVDQPADWIFLPAGPQASVHVDRGVYSVATRFGWSDYPGADLFSFNNSTLLIDPQVAVTQDTTVVLDANDAEKIEISTPDPTEKYDVAMSVWRTPAGESTSFGILVGGERRQTAWALPTEPVTVGSFLFEHAHILGSPQISASVRQDPTLELHPRYQNYSAIIRKLDGKLELPLVDVGEGRPEDFEGVDVEGKVVLLSIGDKELCGWGDCDNNALDRVSNAEQAGAAAVFAVPNSGVPFGFGANGFIGNRGWYPVPTAVLPADEGDALRELLARRQLDLRIDGDPNVSTLYTLSYAERGRIPESLHRQADPRELATIRTTIHGDRPSASQERWRTWRPGTISPINCCGTQVELPALLPAPVNRTEHVGPVSADTVWERQLGLYDLAPLLREECWCTPQREGTIALDTSVDVFDRPVTRSEHWNQAPQVPGQWQWPRAWPEDLQPGQDAVCAACRYGGVEGLFGLPTGSDLLPVLPLVVDGEGHFAELTTWSNDPVPGHEGYDEWHLYADGQELPPRFLDPAAREGPYYALPPGPANYRLTESLRYIYPLGGYGFRSETTWRFTSDTADGKEVPPHYDAFGLCESFARACEVAPLIFLGYQFDLGLDNRVSTPGVHNFTVTAYHQASSGPVPEIAGLKLKASFDGGTHWQDVPATPIGDGRYRVSLNQPELDKTDGTVTLKVEAWDTAGNRVEQTLPEAYGLTAR